MESLLSGSAVERFRIDGRVAVITGGAGFLGTRHAETIAEAGGTPVIWDIDSARADGLRERLERGFGGRASSDTVDITDAAAIRAALEAVLAKFGHVDILINNAANDPKVDSRSTAADCRLESFPLEAWYRDLAVGLTGAFLCSQIVGGRMASQGNGVILNIASDLSLIAPDQRVYRQAGVPDDHQPVKPVTYSVVKHGLIGLTRYLATYWASAGIRVNAISPGGVQRDQPPEFLERVSHLVPLGRLAQPDEYKAAVLFLISDASSYMTGANLVIDGGRTCW